MSSKLTVAQLREALRSRDLDTKGLKADLVARLDEALAEESKDSEENDGDEPIKSRKRVSEQDDDPPPKKPKQDEIQKMTVPALRAALNDRELPFTGKKQELVDRLRQALEEEDGAEEENHDDNSDPPTKNEKRSRNKKAKQEDEEPEEEEEAEAEVEEKKTFTKKGRAVLDENLPEHYKRSYHVLETQTDVYDAMLNFTNLSGNNNKFYALQLLESDAKDAYCAWFRWGRVGEKGQNQQHNGSLDHCLRLFQSKFRDKTGIAWDDRHSSAPRAGKYTLLEMDYENASDPAAEEKGKQVEKPLQSKLESRVEKFISLICNISMMKQQMVEIGYDARKMPLGKLSKTTILKGYAVLKRIEAVLEERGRMDRAMLMDLTSEFYTVVPHDFGRSNMSECLQPWSRLLLACSLQGNTSSTRLRSSWRR